MWIRRLSLAALAVLVPLAVLVVWAKRCRGAEEPPLAVVGMPVKAPPVHLAPREVRTGHPRLILDGPNLAALKEAARKKTPAWQRALEKCEAYESTDEGPGYEAFNWADGAAVLALCWRATGDKKWAAAGVKYLRALVEDQEAIGDRKGSDATIRHDSGYPMRTRGVVGALGYDWLYDAPQMTDAIRQTIARRLDAWIRWYRRAGYQREQPISNYFVGYLTATAMAALGVDGPQAAEQQRILREELLGKRVLPAYGTTLAGGDWPEGWQYGELSAANVALTVAAYRTATGEDLAPRLPWLREVVTHHVHALVPGSSAIYDNGDWGERPTRPGPVAMTVLPIALERSAPEAAEAARFIAKHQLPDFAQEHIWLWLLADRPGAAERDPHLGAPLSLHLPGTGLSFMRSAWTPEAVWASFQSGPTVADHQHNDQGHFELWRGGDALIVDGGDYNSAATLNHNSLLVDDGGRVLNYPPNQGTWGTSMRTERFHDDGEAVVAVGDFTDAYLPKCVEDGCAQRAVRLAKRTLVFLRPATLVIDDRVTLADGKWGVTWAAHVTSAPKVSGNVASAKVGRSRVDIVTVLPERGRAQPRKEPTVKTDHPYMTNAPWGPMWRLEVPSARGQPARRFLHVVQAGAAKDAPPTVTWAGGRGLYGVNVAGAAVLFAHSPDGGQATIAAPKAWVYGLQPGARYRVTATGCEVQVARGGGVAATAGGAVRVSAGSCYNGRR